MSNIQTLRDVMELIRKGDVPGHPFHGNQYTEGESGGAGVSGQAKTVALTQQTISHALSTMNPAIAESYEQRVRHSWQTLQAHPVYSRDPYRAGGDFSNFQHLNLVKPYLERTGTGMLDRTYSLNEEKLKSGAHAYAKEASQEWHGKLVAKVGELEHAQLHYGSGANLRISGQHGSHHVQVDQQMILNVSNKGKVFNQFPARITVNGKAISEKKYKELIGGKH